jgi:zinc transporter, ZIP family
LSDVAFALMLSALAGLSTTIGGLLGFMVRKPGPRFMSLALGFSAGVMILISFVELLAEGIQAVGFMPAHLAFFAGMGGMFLLDLAIPHHYIAEHSHAGEDDDPRNEGLLRTGLLTALGIGLHNFPEGMVTFVAAMEDPALGVAVAIAVALHNIPEGLAVSAPVYAATGSRSKAFWWSFLSGIAEPIGALVAALVLGPVLNDLTFGYVLALVGGFMVFISLDELLPASKEFDAGHLPILGVVAGMVVMAVSLEMLS